MIADIDRGEEASTVFFEAVEQLQEIEDPIAIDKFIQNYKNRNLALEFQLVQYLTNTKRHKILLRNNSAEERKLDRYEQKIFDHSRVVLQKKIENRFKDLDYINANTVSDKPDRVILTQGPKSSTIKDFFLMLRQQDIESVVMLCNLKEDGKTRCENYYDGTKGYVVAQTQELAGGNIIVRTMKDSTSNHVFKHIHYTAWEDHQAPKKYQDITIINDLCNAKNGVVIHCSAGIGRSGTLAVVMKCIRDLQETSQVSVFKSTRTIRERRYGAVKNALQYEFVYEYLRDYLEKRTQTLI